MPANAYSLLTSIVFTLNLNLLILDLPNQVLFGISPDRNEPYSQVFEDIGYESKDFIQNMNLDFYLILFYLFIAVLVLFIK